MANLGDKFKKFLNIEQEVKGIIIKTEVIDNIIELAKQAYPKEFIMLLNGSVKDKTMMIDSLIFQTYHASNDSTLMRFNLPLISRSVGSVHSHPGASNRPSGADLRFFNKHGVVHLIIAYPYNRETIRTYDIYGNTIGFEEE